MTPSHEASSQSPEDRLDDLLLERRRELEIQVARLAETVTDLERREELVRDSRASVERVLRVGSNDLDLREAELADLSRDVTQREERLRAGEVELAQRRSELGAVELRREAVEQRERVLAERDAEIAAREVEIAAREVEIAGREAYLDERTTARRDAVLAFVPGVSYRLAELAPTPLMSGDSLELEGDRYEVARTGPSPLPADARRCAYLVRGARGSSSDGNS